MNRFKFLSSLAGLFSIPLALPIPVRELKWEGTNIPRKNAWLEAEESEKRLREFTGKCNLNG